MNSRITLYVLLGVVATAAAVLSFSALSDLSLVCGFAAQLAWLLPVVIDAGAAAGSLVWLGGQANQAARSFARTLALALLTMSVAANALGHGLEAFRLEPAWWVVVIVSAVAPAVLGAVVHLAVLVGRPQQVHEFDEQPIPYELAAEAYADDSLDEHGVSRLWDAAPLVVEDERTAQLIAAGVGRRRLARELDITEYEARRLLDRARPATSAEPREAAPHLNGSRA